MKKLVVIFDEEDYLENNTLNQVQIFHNEKDMEEFFEKHEKIIQSWDTSTNRLLYCVVPQGYEYIGKVYWANANF